MAGMGRLIKKAVVVLLFVAMFYAVYFWTIDISLKDVQAIAPEPIKSEISRQISSLPSDQQNSLDLPMPEVARYGDIYKGTVVIPQEMEAVPWILNNTNASDKFVADIFGAELIMGMTTRVSTEGGDWANVPDPVRLMTDTNEIYKTDDPARASELAKGMNATLVLLPDRELNTGWWLPQSDYNASKFGDTRYFEEVYRNDGVTIYRIL